MARTVPLARHNAILLAYAKGESLSSMAERFELTESHISQYCRKNGLPARQVQGRKTRKEIVLEEKTSVASASMAEIRRLAALGMGLTRIAAQLRCPYREIQQALQ